jgi:hypothetical protein
MGKARKKKKNDAIAVALRENLYAGRKGMAGQPFYYDEVKKQGSLMLTPSSWKKLDKIAETAGLTRSEFLERVLRGILVFPDC